MLQLVATLVAEIILCCKEVNTKTRAAAYELLIDIAHAMHDARPPPDVIPEDETMGAPPRHAQSTSPVGSQPPVPDHHCPANDAAVL